MRKRSWLAIGLSIAALGIPVQEARAQIFGGGVVVCANCSDEATTLLMKAQQAMQYLQEAQTAPRAIQMAQMMVAEGKMLATHPRTNIMADLNMLSTILVHSQGLAGTMAQMDAQFRQTYGTYNGPDPAIS
jgi:P-type conjugative transfer protein TrbJ